MCGKFKKLWYVCYVVGSYHFFGESEAKISCLIWLFLHNNKQYCCYMLIIY